MSFTALKKTKLTYRQVPVKMVKFSLMHIVFLIKPEELLKKIAKSKNSCNYLHEVNSEFQNGCEALCFVLSHITC